MTTTIGDLLTKIMRDRAAALATSDPAERREAALGVVETAMFMAHKLLGEELLGAALGTVDESDRSAVLHAVARRLHVMSAIFGRMEEDAAAPIKVVEEAIAVARGDAPLLFARRDVHKVNDRVARAKLGALQWDAYLRGRGLRGSDRQARIASAFGQSWETIRRAWRRDLLASLGTGHVTFQLNSAEAEGRKGLPRWFMIKSSDWESALVADGARFLLIQRENNGNR